MAEDAKELLDKVKEIKSKSESYAVQRTKGTVTGAMIGLGGGLLFGYMKKYNLITSAFVGTVIGGIATHLLLPKIEE